ncbi:MAG: hypothetical protein Q8K99_11030 [Actinomycetota bacterium]|nr:hypothetical protein [Actinomycetota bacterium]
MPTRDDVYREFGKAAEIAQAIEYDLGRVLLVHEGIEQRVYVLDAWEPDRAFMDAVQHNTLGRSLRKFRLNYNLVGDFSPLDDALEARNSLAHRFFLQHFNEIETDDGCVAMVAHLEEIQRRLWRGHQLTRSMAEFFIERLESLSRVHSQEG